MDQSNFLLMKEAKIVAMTCTYAALRRQNLSALGFNYDTVIIEEAAQILEIETFIPFVMQSKEYANELKRIVLVGDHLQLPPIVQHHGLQSFGNLEQSMFTRFARLGCPLTILDAQV